MDASSVRRLRKTLHEFWAIIASPNGQDRVFTWKRLHYFLFGFGRLQRGFPHLCHQRYPQLRENARARTRYHRISPRLEGFISGFIVIWSEPFFLSVLPSCPQFWKVNFRAVLDDEACRALASALAYKVWQFSSIQALIPLLTSFFFFHCFGPPCAALH
ncbi:hypothetical protein K432DRAFT_11349 [Lepidopterella palustris CBS 459.81]|uniref:Uncharacterized protein n=1 Tax=Lepidopterella palustris CBS 459.81 TaxID=1314670 RepID=A0A8E2JGN3_9PEZI|nr:hypothetical protein K432DRAFT_11349 [Lepidopterella palustris CBS 459.81]